MLQLELLAVFAYRHVLGSGTLSAQAEPVVGLILGHEREHVRVLSRELIGRGGALPAGPQSTASADQELAARHGMGSLSELHTEKDSLSLLVEVEEVSETVYYHGLSRLHDPGLVLTGSQIMAAEAQHATALSGLLHPGQISRAVPAAFVEGKA
jgi:hypothetical protein